tara:strand:- start:76 stop:246 length:171 start_codon:yes stop_codon:yes gene_type:complete
MYVIIYSNDSTDASVYGPFKTEEQAKKHAKKMYDKFDSYDWNNEAHLDITKMNEVK